MMVDVGTCPAIAFFECHDAAGRGNSESDTLYFDWVAVRSTPSTPYEKSDACSDQILSLDYPPAAGNKSSAASDESRAAQSSNVSELRSAWE